MKFVFKELGEKKISKTVEIDIPLGFGFQSLGFDSVMDFIVSEAAPHFPNEKKKLEAVGVDGQPDHFAYKYVIVYGGIHQRGKVEILS